MTPGLQSSGADTDWRADWDPIIARIGTDIFTLPEHLSWGTPHDVVQWGADRVDASALRRYLEPLEFDSPLHNDLACAQALGHADLVLPVTALLSFAFQPIWQPGGPAVFTSHGRNDAPAVSQTGGMAHFPAAPPGYTAFFGSDFEIEMVRPAVIGDRIGRRGSRLLAVLPKQTSIGRGAFMQWEYEIVDGNISPLAAIRLQMFVYQPQAEPYR